MVLVMRQIGVMLLVFTVLLGGVYPLIVTQFAQHLFPVKAQGSLIVDKNGATVGSALIGQDFKGSKYFWGRLSATSPVPYNAAASSGSNLGVMNAQLIDMVKARVTALQKADPRNKAPIPVDLVTASASGLDPHISLEAARYQADRVAKARHLTTEKVTALIEQYTQGRLFGIVGEPVVNVLQLNLALDTAQ